MKVERRKLSTITPYAKNTKKHDQTQIDNVAESIRQFGFVQPVVIDRAGVIVIGHCRVLAAKQLGMEDVPCVCVEDLTPEQVKALRIVDNKSNESPWDLDFLADELAEVDLSAFDFDFDLEPGEDEEDENNPYTSNTDAPIYTMTGEKPTIAELYDTEKARQLLQNIEKADVSDEAKEFLKFAAYRHVKFDYRKIAEFYAHATEEEQQLFEESALVIIDFDAAIKNGFTKLSKRIEEMRDGK